MRPWKNATERPPIVPSQSLPACPGTVGGGKPGSSAIGDLERLARAGEFPCDRDRVAEPGAEDDAGHGLDVRALPDRAYDPLRDTVPRRRNELLAHETSAAFSRWITSTGVGSTPLRIAT